ncbi:1-deoxy-D-xylulose-5-phosphate reductoisomerase [Massilia sp. HP4]|uniref:1-deoxy-D-xylulose-5-phosphate reductoisomerase n=1 Tax=Massilia sp. HP4 TaxID=2562316 RepID=UPI0010BFCD22|nr:1-deoxy-D-xylulose-5-phosphate reductoisomerase [Massilia sp. HP4]
MQISRQQLVTILGSTGSVGTSTLKVLSEHPGRFTVFALTGNQNAALMIDQCLLHRPRYVAMADEHAATTVRAALGERKVDTIVLAGKSAIVDLAAVGLADIIVAAIAGASGLAPTVAAVRTGKRILLANKESLVMCGRLFMEEARRYRSKVLPIDSELSAIYQCLSSRLQRRIDRDAWDQHGMAGIVLTGSGGPFRTMRLAEFERITPEQACNHPVWPMGKKISVDSATMMNKGLEYIEARWLFDAPPDRIEVLVHPQAVIHSMVRFCDGSVISQMGTPDMRTPIAYALAYPARMTATVAPFDFKEQTLTFAPPDPLRFPCLGLAIDACAAGQAATTALNAANEVAVAAFLNSVIRFSSMSQVIGQVMDEISVGEPRSFEDVIEIDRHARRLAARVINRLT